MTFAQFAANKIAAPAQTDRCEALANSPMVENWPAASGKQRKDELPFQHTTQTYLWALPLINPLGSA